MGYFAVGLLTCSVLIGCNGQFTLSHFDNTPVSSQECNRRPKNSCWMSIDHCLDASYLQVLKAKSLSTITVLECHPEASDQDFLDTAMSISTTNPNRAVKAFVSDKDKYQLTQEIVSPIKTQIIELYFYRCADRSGTFKVGQLELPNLLLLQFYNCDEMAIGKRDFTHFGQIRRISFLYSTIESIEPGTFTNLPQIKSLQLDAGYNGFNGNVGARKIHCDCDYTWLRKWFDVNPHLLDDREEGELYIVGNRLSTPVHNDFIAVDCGYQNLTYTKKDKKSPSSFKFSFDTSC
ncbi:uncharacterized protein LOC129594791 [Paramacrobiotus metropolitanus]|uniref:uncharacterized protein LOC129594791 n=1 Tax=Paramacrobiotus metropolitanus TaxID=2943436 RepID=UPI0024458391|nr:uncharacterized protein LOC129594791 [Paramacrobiotus metropolitanus]